MESNYLELNKNTWNKKTALHVQSEFYDMPSFLAGKSSLNEIELAYLGDVKNKKILHLQCHFGQDSLSLARMGAEVIGVDLSDAAIEKARQLNKELGLNANFICCDLYSLPEHLNETFDIVFTSYGTIGWLPDLQKWAGLISKYLKPGGQFVFAEFHPVVWMFDNDFTKVEYTYFKSEPIVEEEVGTYADRVDQTDFKTITWNHGIGEVLTALIDNGIQIEAFKEYNYSPYNCFSHTKEIEPGKYIIEKIGAKIPMVYALLGKKG